MSTPDERCKMGTEDWHLVSIIDSLFGNLIGVYMRTTTGHLRASASASASASKIQIIILMLKQGALSRLDLVRK